MTRMDVSLYHEAHIRQRLLRTRTRKRKVLFQFSLIDLMDWSSALVLRLLSFVSTLGKRSKNHSVYSSSA